MMGVGDTESKLMFVCDAPNEEEDKKGIPFAGKSGNMLDAILSQLNLKREDIYITPVLKCRPPFNSKPNVSKLNVCSSAYLRKEIQLINPDLIVCLGSTAAKVLLNDVNIQISNVRNTVWYTQGPLPNGIPFIVTYHPAATFHQDHLLDFIVNDLEWAKKLLAGELPKSKKKIRYKKLDKIKDIPEITDAQWIHLDLETDGLDPFLPDKDILSLQISIKEGEGYYFDWTPSIGIQLKNLLKALDTDTSLLRKLNGHNIKFDLKWLREKAGIIFNGTINDTIQNVQLLDENFPNKSLDTVATSFTELKGHKTQFVKMINDYVKMHKEKKEPIKLARARLWKSAFYAIPEHIRIKYGCGDVDAVARLQNKFMPMIEEQELIPLHRLMMNTTKMFVDIECNGMKIDKELIEDFNIKYTKRLKKLKKKLDTLVPYEINHSSPLQLRKLFYGTWKCTPHEIRMGKKRVKYSTGKDARELILKDNISDEVRDYITTLDEYSKTSKLHGTYIKGLPRFLRNGFVHATWRVGQADTGRNTCNDPNLQQIPRTGDIKQLFISRYTDGVLMQVDISQGELRYAAHVSNEPTMLRLFNTGTNDIHRSMASVLLGCNEEEVTEEQRYNTKQVNFGVLYGMGIRTAAQEMKGVSQGEAYRFIKYWHNTFPRWSEYVHEQEKFVIENHYVRNLLGRYRRLFILDPTTPEGMTALRKAINSPIQGGLSDYNKLCGYTIWKRIKAKGLSKECKVIGEVHDSWIYDMRKKHISVMAKIITDVFENIDTSEFNFKFNVSMKVDIKIGKNWKEMEPYEL